MYSACYHGRHNGPPASRMATVKPLPPAHYGTVRSDWSRDGVGGLVVGLMVGLEVLNGVGGRVGGPSIDDGSDGGVGGPGRGNGS